MLLVKGDDSRSWQHGQDEDSPSYRFLETFAMFSNHNERFPGDDIPPHEVKLPSYNLKSLVVKAEFKTTRTPIMAEFKTEDDFRRFVKLFEKWNQKLLRPKVMMQEYEFMTPCFMCTKR